jgi:CheY-like chemotaxis protein
MRALSCRRKVLTFAECGNIAIMQRSGYVAIVDDDASMREALARLLRIHEINSRSYPSARVFLEGLASGMPDCLIVDVNMPEMTGVATRTLEPWYRHPDHRDYCE